MNYNKNIEREKSIMKYQEINSILNQIKESKDKSFKSRKELNQRMKEEINLLDSIDSFELLSFLYDMKKMILKEDILIEDIFFERDIKEFNSQDSNLRRFYSEDKNYRLKIHYLHLSMKLNDLEIFYNKKSKEFYIEKDNRKIILN